MQKTKAQDLSAEVQELRARLEEAEATLEAIRTGKVDGLVVSTPKGEQIYTLTGAEKPYRVLIEEMKEGAVLVSEDNRVLYCNKGFAKILKHTIEKLIGAKIHTFVSPNHIASFEGLLASGRMGKGVMTREIALKGYDKIIVPTQISINSLITDDVKTTFLVVTDLTQHMEEDIKRYTANLEEEIKQRKKAERALEQQKKLAQEEKDRLSSLLNSITDEVWFADTEKKFTLANPSAIKEFKLASSADGVDVENLAESLEVLRPDGSLRPVEDAPSLRALKGEFIKNQEEIIRTPVKGELRTRQVSSAPVRDLTGTIIGSVSVVRDITDQKKAQEALKESEHLYHTVFDNSQDGFQLIELMYDEHGKPFDHKFLKVNHAYEEIIGVKAEDILDKTARYISPNVESHWFEVPDRVIKTGKSEHVELYNKDINKWLDCFYFLYSKNVVGTLFRDVTDRKRLEKQLQDQERLATIGATAGMVGHDIRNPLQAITGDVFLAKSDLASMPDCEGKQDVIESLTEVEKNIDYINKIVADLKDFAKPLNPRAEQIDLKLIIEGLLAKNGLPENVEVSVNVEAKARNIVADSTFISRIMYNLVTNAVQAMPNGGSLTILAIKEADDVVVSVKDTGVGIAESVKSKLFTPMFTTKPKGQGFGLAVIKRMTEALGGTVTFESTEGKGTTFIIRLPPQRLQES